MKNYILPMLFFLSGCLFVVPNLYAQTANVQEETTLERYVHKLVNDVIENNRTVDKLTEELLNELPLGIAPKVAGSIPVVIAIDSAKYDAKNKLWHFSAYASIALPGTTKRLAFGAKNISFHPGGIASTSDTRLVLLTSVPIDIANNVTLELTNDGENYITFNCDGFNGIGLKGLFVFSPDLIVPDSIRAPEQSVVTAAFRTKAASLNDIFMDVNITPFRLAKAKGIAFEVTSATADFSDFANPNDFFLPREYQDTYGNNLELWRGFYLRELKIHWDDLQDVSSKPLSILARNVLVDDFGLSGSFSATNLCSLSDGSAGGWPFSIEVLSVTLQMSQITSAGFQGQLAIPFLGENPVAYEALIQMVDDKLNYRFAIATTADREFSLPLSAKLKIDEASIIMIERKQARLIPSAVLNGKLTVEHRFLKFKGIAFEKLHLTAARPYVKSGSFSALGDNEGVLNGFPLQLDSINLKVYQGAAALTINASLNFMNSDDQGFSGSTKLYMLAKLEELEESIPGTEKIIQKQKWTFDKLKVSDIALDVKVVAFRLKGSVAFYEDDPVFGNGFKGRLSLTIKPVFKNGIKVSAFFGSLPTFRYWHFDVLLPTASIPIGGPAYIDGVVGGVSYHMVRKDSFVPNFKKLAQKVSPAPLEFEYIPNEEAGISFMAGVTLVVGQESVLNADAVLELAFNKSGGLRYVMFTGNAYFFTSPDKRERPEGMKKVPAPVYAGLQMLFDNDNDAFHANLEVYMNLAGLVKGTGPNNLLGKAVIHVDPQDWYIHIGKASQMLGVNILNIATAQGYFMIGTQIENIPPPPPEVREIFEDIEPLTMRDENALSGGRGFAVGAHMKIGYDSKKDLLPFYVSLFVGAGADIMLRNYGEAYCIGRPDKIGIDGWYASGQAYVFLKGRVGIRVRKQNFDFLSLGAAALLQAQLPNPTYMVGRLGGRFKILGGLIKGKFNLKLQIGDKCELVIPGSEIEDIEVIADLKPETGESEINVFTATQVSFNTNIDTEFRMPDFKQEIHAYRIKLDELTIKKDGVPLEASIVWNEMKDVAVLKTRNILPPQSELTAVVKIHWEKKGNNGAWGPVKNETGIIYETKETSFSTGTAPKFIPQENVVYSYPINGQSNFHIAEVSEGYIKLNFAQDYLFEKVTGDTTWQYIARFYNGNSIVAEEELRYSPEQSSVLFTLPASLATGKTYKFLIIKRPASAGPVDANLERNEKTFVSNDEETTVASNQNTLSGMIRQEVESKIYASAFRTSRHRTFAEKWNSLAGDRDLMDVAIGNLTILGKSYSNVELLDEFEVQPFQDNPPLLSAVAGGSHWMDDIVSPVLYNSYPLGDHLTITWRRVAEFGIKPLKAIKIFNKDFQLPALTQAQIDGGTKGTLNDILYVNYNLSYYSFHDYEELRNKAAALYADSAGKVPQGITTLLSTQGYTDLIKGKSYPVNISYTLPGKTTPSFTRVVTINY